MSMAGAVDCPQGWPAGCAMKAAITEPLPLELVQQQQPLGDRAKAAAVEAAAFGMLELIGLLASPVTLGGAGVVTSILAMTYAAIRDLDDGRYRIVPRLGGARVVDVETGRPATGSQAVQRNLPLVLAWSIAVLPDPLGLLGWMAVGFLLALDVMLVLVRRDRRRLGDLLAGTAVVSDPERSD